MSFLGFDSFQDYLNQTYKAALPILSFGTMGNPIDFFKPLTTAIGNVTGDIAQSFGTGIATLTKETVETLGKEFIQGATRDPNDPNAPADYSGLLTTLAIVAGTIYILKK